MADAYEDLRPDTVVLATPTTPGTVPQYPIPQAGVVDLVTDLAGKLSPDANGTLLLGGAAASPNSKLAILGTKTVAVPAANTVWRALDFQASTLTLTAGGVAPAELSAVRFAAPVITQTAGAAYTVPLAATVIIDGPPTAGAGGGATPTLDSSYTLDVRGATIVDGNLHLKPIGNTNRTIDFGNAYDAAAIWLFNAGAGQRFGWGLRIGEMQFFLSPYTDGTRHFSWNIGGDLQPSGTNELMRLTESGNLCLGTTSFGANAAKCVALSNSATAPTTSVDLCHLYCADNGAGSATLAIYSEEDVEEVGVKTVTEVYPMFINGVLKYVALAA